MSRFRRDIAGLDMELGALKAAAERAEDADDATCGEPVVGPHSHPGRRGTWERCDLEPGHGGWHHAPGEVGLAERGAGAFGGHPKAMYMARNRGTGVDLFYDRAMTRHEGWYASEASAVSKYQPGGGGGRWDIRVVGLDAPSPRAALGSERTSRGYDRGPTRYPFEVVIRVGPADARGRIQTLTRFYPDAETARQNATELVEREYPGARIIAVRPARKDPRSGR